MGTRMERAGMRAWMAGLLLLLGGAIAAAAPLPGPGDRLPDVVLQDLTGGDHELAAALGKGPVVVFFWSVYCPNCKEAMPGLVGLHRKWRERGLTVWAVNVDGDRFSNAVRAYVSDMELPFPVLYDRLEGDLLVAADPLGVSKTPTLFLADGDGRILLRQTVEVDYEALATAVASSLH
ncbi:MAG: TlpA family protein disulfide reductase [Deltaproteobacteria bacterium]|nr:TlpA family protein disulfide reductase [Deltaproteobacteria bacterium]